MNDTTNDNQHMTTPDSGGRSPSLSDADRPRPTLSQLPRDQHILTTEEALLIFEQAGIPRDKRSIQRYCKLGKLDCDKNGEEDIYYIALASAERLIGKIKEIQARHAAPLVAASGPPKSDGVRHPPAMTRHEPDDARQPEIAHPRIKELEGEVATLKSEIKTLEEKHFTVSYEKKASEQMVNMLREQLKEDRKEFFQQMDKLMKEVGETRQLVGQLETQLKQLAAPTSHTASVTRPITEAEIIDSAPQTTRDDTPPTASPATHATFADIREPHSEERV